MVMSSVNTAEFKKLKNEYFEAKEALYKDLDGGLSSPTT